jgi:di/tricarboxylate transporter
LEPIVLNFEMMVVLGLLAFTVFMFVTEIVRVDIAAILVLVLVGALSYLPGLGGLADMNHIFDGFASNAVISIIAVMIVGAGLDKTGLMSSVAAWILKVGGTKEKRIVPIVSGTVGVISSFMQNVGAAALFLPVVSRISARTNIELSRLLMPMGFCAILGGTMTLVGSSPLILLNDLIETANQDLPAHLQMRTYGLFSVTPIGAALVITGLLYFTLFGRWVLPKSHTHPDAASAQSMPEYLNRVYGLQADVFEIDIPKGSKLEGHTISEIMDKHHLYVVGTYYNGLRVVAPIVTTEILTPCRLAILGEHQAVLDMVKSYGLSKRRIRPELDIFAEEFAPTNAGVAEIVIPPNSNMIGKTPKDLGFRKALGINLLAIHRIGDTISHIQSEDHEACHRIGLFELQVGDTLVVQSRWSQLTSLKKNRNVVVVTSDFPQDEMRPQKVGWALLFFAISVALILFTDVRLSLCLLIGAVGMIATKVLDIDDAYDAVGWNTVFLLASLIPLGTAVQRTGTADWIAQQVMALLQGWPVWTLQVGVAILATVFTLIMSNVGATVLLVPLAISIAVASGGDPAIFAMTVAISTSNSFLIPTHQVNALIMGPGGYRVADFVRTGGIMTVLFLAVSMLMMNLVLG